MSNLSLIPLSISQSGLLLFLMPLWLPFLTPLLAYALIVIIIIIIVIIIVVIIIIVTGSKENLKKIQKMKPISHFEIYELSPSAITILITTSNNC